MSAYEVDWDASTEVRYEEHLNRRRMSDLCEVCLNDVVVENDVLCRACLDEIEATIADIEGKAA